jgi:uncharacterized protein (TIGR02145 family)/prepilin-type N-terminal cleavage/methylation domain-containing protein
MIPTHTHTHTSKPLAVRRTSSPRTHTHGFTIIELLIVIVVIAILAAIAVLSYGGIQREAHIATLKADITNAQKQLGLDNARTGIYPALQTEANNNQGLPASPTTSYQYDQLNNGTGYCLTASSSALPGYSLTASSTSGVEEGACTGHTVPGGGNNNAQTPVNMSDLTSSYCQNNMTIYNGTNPNAILTLHDPRGTGQDYEVAKLADNRCWMIENLRLGSTSGTTALTPSDTNISQNWTLPQLTTTSAVLATSPQVAGPVTGDNGTGAQNDTNYGYIYIWCGATAGGTASGGSDTCKIANTPPFADATGDVCAAGWRLPTGNIGGEFANLDLAFGGNGNTQTNTPPHLNSWSNGGAFKGVISGSWVGQNQFLWQKGDVNIEQGTWWSSNADASTYMYSWVLTYDEVGTIYPGTMSAMRIYGYAVRCILN